MLIEGSFEARVTNFPKLYYPIEGILAIAENVDGNLSKADDVENRVTQEIQKLACEVIQGWADNEVSAPFHN